MKLLKTLIIAIIVGGLLLGAALPALAAGSTTDNQPAVSFLPEKGKDGKGPWFQGKVKVIQGEVDEVGTDYITVDDKKITVPEGTKIQWPGQKDAKLGDIEEGMRVVVLVDERDAGTWYARHIIVIPSKPAKPEYRHHVGEVTDYHVNESITIKDKQGEKTTFTIIDGKFKILPPGAEVGEGKWVTVLSRRDPVQDRLIAFGVVVHPEKPSERPWLGLERVNGVINTIDKNTKTITIDSTVVKYDDKTIFVLKGVPDPVGQSATVFYRVQADGTELAKFVLVKIDLPGIRAELEEGQPER